MKPRIRKYGHQLWACTGRGVWGFGKTTKEAYDNWAAFVEGHVTRLQERQDK